MVRWWSLSVFVAVAAVLFGFDGISAGPHAIGRILLVGTLALVTPVVAPVLASIVARRTEASR
jgi:uncharacterized membrane protein YtjA (UPF0391 family)